MNNHHSIESENIFKLCDLILEDKSKKIKEKHVLKLNIIYYKKR